MLRRKSFGNRHSRRDLLVDDPYKSGNIKRRRSTVSEKYVPGVGIISSIACQHFDLN
jgi:hypothetical protein